MDRLIARKACLLAWAKVQLKLNIFNALQLHICLNSKIRKTLFYCFTVFDCIIRFSWWHLSSLCLLLCLCFVSVSLFQIVLLFVPFTKSHCARCLYFSVSFLPSLSLFVFVFFSLLVFVSVFVFASPCLCLSTCLFLYLTIRILKKIGTLAGKWQNKFHHLEF